MTSFPTSIASFREIENLPGITYNPDDKKTLYAEDVQALNDEVQAIESTLGANPQGSNSTVADRLSAIESYISALDERYFPIGSIYYNATNATNPATLLGFGTWERYLIGRSFVGYNATDSDFDTTGAKGGEKKHTLTVAELPNITGSFRIPDNVATNNPTSVKVSSATGVFSTSSTTTATVDLNNSTYVVPNATKTDTINMTFGLGWSHNNMQPYEVGHAWKRVA